MIFQALFARLKGKSKRIERIYRSFGFKELLTFSITCFVIIHVIIDFVINRWSVVRRKREIHLFRSPQVSFWYCCFTCLKKKLLKIFFAILAFSDCESQWFYDAHYSWNKALDTCPALHREKSFGMHNCSTIVSLSNFLAVHHTDFVQDITSKILRIHFLCIGNFTDISCTIIDLFVDTNVYTQVSCFFMDFRWPLTLVQTSKITFFYFVSKQILLSTLCERIVDLY